MTTRKRLQRWIGTHPILWLIASRLVGALVVLVVLSVLVFALIQIAPGDIATNLVGIKYATPDALAAVREQYGLDLPVWQQYVAWLGRVLEGDLGTSIRNQTSVATVLAERVPATAQLAGIAFVLALVTAVPLGLLSAVRAGTWPDRLANLVALVGVSAPAFAVAILLLYTFALRFGWFPLYGIGDGGIDTLHHLVLPAVTLALGLFAIILKMTRTAVLRELDRDYVTFARARGIGTATVLRLVLRNAAAPIITGAGLVLTYLVGGAIFVETVFALPGLGTLIQDAVLFKDIPVVQATTLLVAGAIALVTFGTDLICKLIDPRSRVARSAADAADSPDVLAVSAAR